MEATLGVTILFLLNSLHIGGTEVHSLELAKALRRRGVRVIFAALGGPLLDEVIASGMGWRALPPGWHLGLERLRRATIAALDALVRNEPVDIVHCHFPMSCEIKAHWAAGARLPTVVTVHGEYFRPSDLAVAETGRGAIVAVSEAIARVLRSRGHHVALIRNGIDLDQFAPGEPPELGAGGVDRADRGRRLQVLYVARLTGLKGTIAEDCVRAIRELGRHLDLESLIVGDGPASGAVAVEAMLANREAAVS